MKAISRLLIATVILGTVVACGTDSTAPIASGSFRANITGKSVHGAITGKAGFQTDTSASKKLIVALVSTNADTSEASVFIFSHGVAPARGTYKIASLSDSLTATSALALVGFLRDSTEYTCQPISGNHIISSVETYRLTGSFSSKVQCGNNRNSTIDTLSINGTYNADTTSTLVR